MKLSNKVLCRVKFFWKCALGVAAGSYIGSFFAIYNGAGFFVMWYTGLSLLICMLMFYFFDNVVVE